MGEDYNGDRSARSARVLANDFVEVTRLAVSAGAEFIELNLSCPNTIGVDGEATPPLCYDVDLAVAIVLRVRHEVGASVKLGVKLSYLEHADLIKFLDGAALMLDFVSGINTVAHPVASAPSEGAPYFGSRTVAGIGGTVIRSMALDFVRSCALYRADRKMNFAIIGVGGVTDPESFAAMHEAGADVVQAVTGVFLNSLLAVDCMRALGATLRSPLDDAEKDEFLRRATSQLPVPEWEFTTTSELPVAVATELLDELVGSGALTATSRSGVTRYIRTDSTRQPSASV